MKITSPAFEHGDIIPQTYTCDGMDISPPLLFIDVPKEAQSLALIMEDPDVPKTIRPDGLWVHWLVWDMPSDVAEIPEGVEAPGVIGQNTSGEARYHGPCPPQAEHRYFFKLFALDINLTEARIASREDFFAAMAGHILAETELMGKYNRQKT
ncbi:MAG: kinase inhibitor [Candidatus Doudnabacteria bacterium RIFCSPLOWO2_02_FULL_48_8]|uniref:Kinase inhibitor n=1 Tax=Candidatus Doudnabacteria bacterium RIFCSPHIGHO2_01_FULL_46_24 TaxID=1817825 RepID=A0A1F5NTC2_9BACT|nr:MAG: kinase inhibitor [Candidatus Doudnabacteria bacterium RIFCSPHIGHO2_01_FULL_46_24]OGE95299.1 MAG: kinase inhibitor [Candidatus Doudnabacteria bacterium RIFCSPLOWO2_02_FULL_48_8]OGE96148.1 MAG: kinase inhibitor [Candidatus Doudnabacteria bacterium RIFCSPHIGHO2_12_FULL_48_11]